ncbi:MAG TPA: TIGR02594 family protein, partial [bacterium]|nr:TIGR02594 family protein [bacterium]
NPRIVEYLQSTMLESPWNANDETPWCSAFVNWCVERAGYEGTDSAWARSWFYWGTIIESPERGCIAVFKRNNDPYCGHVGFFIEENQNGISVLGGNQSNSVKTSWYSRDDLLGFRIPG